MKNQPSTVGVLYPGEMGTAVAALLAARGLRVVTTAGQRSDQTLRRCRAAGIEVMESLADVVRSCDVIVSLVPPAAAQEVAGDYCKLAHLGPREALYVDMNSIGPALAVELARQVDACGRAFVDGAINGLAKNLATSCTLFLSGPRAAEVGGLFGDAMKVQLLGDLPGRASAMKMLLSGLSKGVCALFVETALTARRHGMLKEMTEAYARIYPGVMGIVERMMPTYPQHASRRSDEMKELEQTVSDAGLEPCMLAAARHVHELLAAVEFTSAAPGTGAAPGTESWTIQSIIEHLAATEFLSADAAGTFPREKYHGQ